MGRREWYFSMIEWKESKSNWYSSLFSLFQENQWIEVRNWYFWCACYEIQAVLGSLQRCTFKRWYSHSTSFGILVSFKFIFFNLLWLPLSIFIILYCSFSAHTRRWSNLVNNCPSFLIGFTYELCCVWWEHQSFFLHRKECYSTRNLPTNIWSFHGQAGR